MQNMCSFSSSPGSVSHAENTAHSFGATAFFGISWSFGGVRLSLLKRPIKEGTPSWSIMTFSHATQTYSFSIVLCRESYRDIFYTVGFKIRQASGSRIDARIRV